jgi:hypothetical protein
MSVVVDHAKSIKSGRIAQFVRGKSYIWSTTVFYVQLAATILVLALFPPVLVAVMLWDSWRSRGDRDAWQAEEDDALYRASYGVHGRPL